MKNQNFVLIVAAGIGNRMKSNLPKQYLILKDKPVLMHTITQFFFSKSRPQIIIVIDRSMETYWKSLCEEYNFEIPHHITYGGQTRFQSVKNGIACIKFLQPSLTHTSIAVHDAARPLIAVETIDLAYEHVKTSKAVIVARKSVDSVRLSDHKLNKAIDRDHVWLVQTPQIFDGQLLAEAYEQEELEIFTDDASVVEKLGNQITIVEGHYTNIKITYPEDLQIAQLYLQNMVN